MNEPVSSTRPSTDPAPDPAALAHEMDQLSLEQALIDFEIANARVRDLTERLVEATSTIQALREELGRLRQEHAELQELHDEMRSSAAFRLASRLWAIRNALRR
ncbi:MAG: hypothetical protein M5U14_13845 [Acidimicrobiia bacterium]|nr:hypothetical protein [Acidimicrobiia bacterium]